MFTGLPSYYRLRALHLSDPYLRGEDVYALQTGLSALGLNPGAHDGVFGSRTNVALLAAQKALEISADGRVGPLTWTELTNAIAIPIRRKHGVAVGLLYGQLSHESGLRGGMYSLPPRSDGTFDAGVAQRNTKYHSIKAAFGMPGSIELLAYTVKASADYYTGVTDKRRRWGLAAGSWNAPAFANHLAWEDGARHIPSSNRLNPDNYSGAREKIEAYITSASSHLRV